MAVQGDVLVSVSADRTVKVWRWQTGEILTAFTSDMPVCCLAVASDQHIVVAGDEMGHLWPNAALRRLMVEAPPPAVTSD